MIAFNSISTKSGSNVCMELTMVPSHWMVTKHHVEIRPQAKTFAPGNLRATSDNFQYKALLDYWINNKYTLRYSGGLVPDVYHILIKGQGVFSNASSQSAKAKLRLLYECAPVGLIIESAGGMTTVAPCEAGQEQLAMSILDVPIGYFDKRVGICVGSVEEVERFKSHIFG
jgi:sedoheptulose-bisphosphatase